MGGSHSVIFGFHPIAEALKRSEGAGTLYIADDRKRNRELRALAAERSVRVANATAEELTRMSGGSDHRGALYLPARESQGVELRGELERLGGGPRLVVVLDHVEDPHNLGAVFRSADQFGADLVVIPERRAAQVTPAVARASAGASAHIKTAVVGNVAASIRMLKDARFWVFGAHLEGQRLDQVSFPERTALVLGSEGHGLADLVARQCDLLARIPSAGNVDSLNVSVAAGIFLYEVRRSQGFFGRPDPLSPGT